MVKLMTIIGTRPEIIKMCRVISEFDLNVNHVLVHTGQNYDYELNQIFFNDLGIRKPDYFLKAAKNGAAQTISKIISEVDKVLDIEKPDAVLLYGDTNSSLSVIAAKRRQIPVFHMEAGNRCFDQRVPEELNRKIIDHLSDVNFVLTEHARRYLIAEGIRPEMIIKTGSHLKEVLTYFDPKIKESEILKTLKLKSRKYFLISFHREENVDDDNNLKDFIECLNALAEVYNMPIIVSTHPRTQLRLNKIKVYNLNSKINFLKPFGFFDYIKLQTHALCVISDSGTISEEASLLNFSAIMIRNAHERPEGMDTGILIMTGLKKEKVLEGVKVILSQRNKTGKTMSDIQDYTYNSSVSKQILRVVLSYIDYVNRIVWSKRI